MQERGGSRLNLVLGLAVTAVLILVVVRIVPVYVRHYEFQDAVRNQAKFAGVEGKSPEVIRQELLKKAQSLNLAMTREQIVVLPTQGGVKISARYSVPVDLIVFQHNLKFDISADTFSVY